jgi:hypothetical protein
MTFLKSKEGVENIFQRRQDLKVKNRKNRKIMHLSDTTLSCHPFSTRS